MAEQAVETDYERQTDDVEDDGMPKHFRVSYPFLLRCVMTAALGSLLLGYDLGIISGAIVPIKNEFDLSGFEVEILTSSITFASIIGSLIAGLVADKFGRKIGLMTSAIIFLIGSIGMASSFSFAILIAWRCFTGIGVGMGLVICPMYCAELAPRRMRGAMTSFNEMFINVGIPLAFFANLILSGLPNDWRWMLLSGGVPALALLITTCFLPESPRWLLKVGKEDQARATVRNLVHPEESGDIKTAVAKATLEEMRKDFDQPQITWTELFLNDKRTFFIAMTFAFFQQIIGTDAILFYGVYTFETYGINQQIALVMTLVMGILKLIFTIVASTIVDFPKVGRRKPLLVGGFICMLGTGAVGVSCLFPRDSSTAGGVIFGILLFICGFGLSYGPLCWLILAEMFTGPYRSKALSLGSVINRLTSFMVTAVYISMTEGMGFSGTYFLLAFFALCGLVFSYFYIPELVGQRLGSRAGSIDEKLGVGGDGSVNRDESDAKACPRGSGPLGASRVNNIDEDHAEIGD